MNEKILANGLKSRFFLFTLTEKNTRYSAIFIYPFVPNINLRLDSAVFYILEK